MLCPQSMNSLSPWYCLWLKFYLISQSKVLLHHLSREATWSKDCLLLAVLKSKITALCYIFKSLLIKLIGIPTFKMENWKMFLKAMVFREKNNEMDVLSYVLNSKERIKYSKKEGNILQGYSFFWIWRNSNRNENNLFWYEP